MSLFTKYGIIGGASEPDGYFLAVTADDRSIYKSYDLINWEFVGTFPASNGVRAIAGNAGLLFANAYGSSAYGYKSINEGKNWTSFSTINGAFQLIYNPVYKMYGATYNNDTLVRYSRDGVTWLSSGRIGGSGYESKCIAINDIGTIVGMTNDPFAKYRTEAGATWTSFSTSSLYSVENVVTNGNKFLIIGNWGTNGANLITGYSTTGESWTWKEQAKYYMSPDRSGAGSDFFWIANKTQFRKTTNGSSFTNLTHPFANYEYFDMVYAEKKFIAYNGTNLLKTSSDCVTWANVQPNISDVTQLYYIPRT